MQDLIPVKYTYYSNQNLNIFLISPIGLGMCNLNNLKRKTVWKQQQTKAFQLQRLAEYLNEKQKQTQI